MRHDRALDLDRGKAHDIEPIARIESLFAGDFDPLAKEARDEFRVAQRPARAGGEMLHDAIDAEQADIDFARAFGMALEQRAEFVRKA